MTTDRYRPDLTTAGIFTVYESNAESVADYYVRSALIRATDAAEFNRRHLAGLAVQKRVRIGKTAGRVVQLPQRRIAGKGIIR